MRRDLSQLARDERLVSDCRLWIAECVWREDEDELAELTALEVIRGVNRHYDGGIEQFIRDGM